MPSRRVPLRSSAARFVFIGLGGLLALLVGGWLAGQAWVEAYLRGPEFRRFVNGKVGDTLRAEVDFAPFQFTGLSVFSEGIQAQGFEGAPFARAEVGQVRAQFSLRRFFEKVWLIESIEAQRLVVKLDGSRLSAPLAGQPSAGAGPRTASSWLPNRLEIASALIREVEIAWGDLPSTSGALRGVQLRAVPAEGGWQLEGRGGELAASGLPALTVDTLTLRQRDSALFINDAAFTAKTGGTVRATGEVQFAEKVDVRAKLEGIDLAPFLASDWRARLHGKATGDLRVQTPLPARGQLVVSGSLQLRDGRLEALPVLNQIALFTNTQQYRQLTLTHARADFRRERGELRVTNLTAESQGLLRLEGAFTIAQAVIDGTFQVGVAPASLQWLPGSQERVFTTARDGYLWTTMRLSGPVESPSEDLTSRLVAAAGGAVVEKVENTARDVIRTGREAARSALDLLFPK
jgi:hypothetical protein